MQGSEMTKLRSLRVNRMEPLTLTQLSERTGFSRSQLCDVELGKIGAGNVLIARLAKVYGRSVKYIRRLCEEARREFRRAA
jgi:transcriptional regulator with XRE-family HTH domain